MTWCKAFDPIDENPHGARIPTHPPVARTREPEPRTAARRFLHERFPPAHIRTRASGRRSHFCTNEFDSRTSEPERRPEPAEMHERTPTTRPNPPRADLSDRPNEFQKCTAEPEPPAAAARTVAADHSAEPAPRRRTSVLPARTPEPERPSARHFPPRRHPSDHLPAATPAAPPARPPSLRSGFRPGAAPVPPSASLPEDRYHPVNAALNSAAGSWHVARHLLLSP